MNWQVMIDSIPRLLGGAVLTLQLVALAALVGFVLALFLALARLNRNPLLWMPAYGFIFFFRGTPLLVQIFFLYFILPDFGIVLPAFATGVLALGLHYATYCSEVYRAGLENIPKGQWEASTALNLSPFHTFKDVIIPQAVPPVVPALGNYLIAMFKETPLLSFIAVVELMQEAKLIGSEWFRYTEAITLVGVFFLVMSLIASVGVRRVERALRLPGR